MSSNYIIETGNIDRRRLEISYKLLSPVTQAFLLQHGLKPGMTILDFGCGMGDMSCWFAKYVGINGRVIGIDSSEASLSIAREKAQKYNLNNIQFICMDIKDVKKLDITFDFIYGKWILIHILDKNSVLHALYGVLKPGGIFSGEEVLKIGEGHFSYPNLPVIQKYVRYVVEYVTNYGLIIDTGERLFSYFKELGLNDINLKAHQAILVTEEEKSIFRLEAHSMRKSCFNNLSDEMFGNLVDELISMEKSDSIVGGVRNIIAIGKKSFTS